ENYPNDHGHHYQMKILGPKRQSKYVETPFQHIEHQKLVSIDLHKGGNDQKNQQGITDILSIVIKPTAGLFGKNPSPFALLGNGSYGIPKVFFHCILPLNFWDISQKSHSTTTFVVSGTCWSVCGAFGSIQ